MVELAVLLVEDVAILVTGWLESKHKLKLSIYINALKFTDAFQTET
jgi:hypothetical protein